MSLTYQLFLSGIRPLVFYLKRHLQGHLRLLLCYLVGVLCSHVLLFVCDSFCLDFCEEWRVCVRFIYLFIYLFICWGIPAPFGEETISVKRQLSIFMWVYFSVLYFVSLTYLSVFPPILHYRFKVSLEVR